MKRCYIITFEIADPTTRTALTERLKAYGSFCPIHEHCWAILTDQSAAQIRDFLTSLLGPTDRLFVIRSGTEAAWLRSYGESHNEWLKKYL